MYMSSLTLEELGRLAEVEGNPLALRIFEIATVRITELEEELAEMVRYVNSGELE